MSVFDPDVQLRQRSGARNILQADNDRREERERASERDLYFPWLQVPRTGPRRHLAAGYESVRRGFDWRESYLQYRLQVWSLGLGFAAWLCS